MEIKNIERLARLMRENELTLLEVTEDGVSVKLERRQNLPEAAPAPGQRTFTHAAADGTESAANAPGTVVTSPTVGVFYTASSPESRPFVEVGDMVRQGDVLCIIEAMKLMNEIPAELDGTIAEIYVSNGQMVEYGQPLLRIVSGGTA